MTRLMMTGTLALALVLSAMAAHSARAQEGDQATTVISGTVMKLDLDSSRGLLTTDLGKPVFFDIPKAYLFENVTQGARITLQLDDHGRAVKVMDTSIADFVPAVMPAGHVTAPPLAANVPDEGPAPIEDRR